MQELISKIDGSRNFILPGKGPGSSCVEATDDYRFVKALWEQQGFPCKIKDRVGPDIYASCGMFME